MTLVYGKPSVRNAWADSAVPVTDIVDPGNTLVAAGWTQSLVPPPRQYFNWTLNWSASAVRYFMQRGVVDYDPAELYQADAIVQGPTGLVFQSLQNNNSNNALPATLVANAWWGPLNGYATTANLSGYVTTAALTADLAAYVLTTTLNATLLNYVSNSALTTTLAGYATTGALAAEAATARNAANLTNGTVPNGRLPNIGSLPGVTIQADPGTTPSGSPGQMFFYY